MPGPIAALALVTLGGGIALGGMSYKRARDAKKKDKYPELTDALANDHDKAPTVAPVSSGPTRKRRPATSTSQVA